MDLDDEPDFLWSDAYRPPPGASLGAVLWPVMAFVVVLAVLLWLLA